MLIKKQRDNKTKISSPHIGQFVLIRGFTKVFCLPIGQIFFFPILLFCKSGSEDIAVKLAKQRRQKIKIQDWLIDWLEPLFRIRPAPRVADQQGHCGDHPQEGDGRSGQSRGRRRLPHPGRILPQVQWVQLLFFSVMYHSWWIDLPSCSFLTVIQCTVLWITVRNFVTGWKSMKFCILAIDIYRFLF